MSGITFGKHSRLSGGAQAESRAIMGLFEYGCAWDTQFHRELTHHPPMRLIDDAQRIN